MNLIKNSTMDIPEAPTPAIKSAAEIPLLGKFNPAALFDAPKARTGQAGTR